MKFSSVPSSKRLSSSIILAVLTTSIVSVIPETRAGSMVVTDGKKEVVAPTSATQDPGGFYISLFGGANVSQSSGEKQINVADGRPQPAGTPAEIQAYRATPGNDIPPTAKLIPDGTSEQSPTFTTGVGSDYGWLAGVKLGYGFPAHHLIQPVLEFEAFYNGIIDHGLFKTKKSLDGIRSSDRDGDELLEPFSNPDATVPRTKLTANAKDQMNSGVFMQNAILKFDLGRFKPYIGAGAGLAYVTHSYSIDAPKGAAVPSNAAALLQTRYIGVSKYDGGAVERLPLNHSNSQIEDSPAGYVTFNNDSEVTFAYQAIAGVDYVLSARMTLFGEYKALFYYDGPYYKNLLNNEVVFGVRFSL